MFFPVTTYATEKPLLCQPVNKNWIAHRCLSSTPPASMGYFNQVRICNAGFTPETNLQINPEYDIWRTQAC
ncbi:hypothetical protein GV64_13515 [Endozoicomonas elysicola]|uniref:Uncharacterized protein n=1 Tax=Endozoicomonas elysicola TaxID=305900 RepID=A0A081KBU5_9GAMM|nr:hypothetical protein GV64_13515 [Endozoicomonas elysicola]